MSIETSTYLRHLERSKNTHNYFLFFRPYMQVMSLAEAVFIQDLINIGSMPRTKRKMIDGKEFFQCKESFLEESGIFWQSDKQSRLLRTLRQKGYVLTKKLGIPPTRWMLIDICKIELDIDNTEAQKSDNQSPQKYGDRQPQKYGEHSNKKEEVKKEISSGRRSHADNNNFFSFPPQLKACAAKLIEAVRSRKPGVIDSRSTVAGWTKTLSVLLKDHAVEEIEETVDVYSQHLGEQMWPHAYCAKHFVEKYNRIRNKMDIDKNGEYKTNADGKKTYVPKPKNYVTERVPSKKNAGCFTLVNHFEGTQRYKELVAEGYTVKVQLD